PLWLDLDGLRVVHACWHAPFIEWLFPRPARGNLLTRDLLIDATTEPVDPEEKDTSTPSVFKAVEALIKGLEIPLPAANGFLDKDGIGRHRVRVQWWNDGATRYRDIAMLPEPERLALP